MINRSYFIIFKNTFYKKIMFVKIIYFNFSWVIYVDFKERIKLSISKCCGPVYTVVAL